MRDNDTGMNCVAKIMIITHTHTNKLMGDNDMGMNCVAKIMIITHTHNKQT